MTPLNQELNPVTPGHCVKVPNLITGCLILTVALYLGAENEDCCYIAVIVKATNGPRYVVGCRRQIDKSKLKSGTRVALDMTTLTIMR